MSCQEKAFSAFVFEGVNISLDRITWAVDEFLSRMWNRGKRVITQRKVPTFLTEAKLSSHCKTCFLWNN